MTFFWKEKEAIRLSTIQCWREELGWHESHLHRVLATLTRKGAISFLKIEDDTLFRGLISQEEYYTQLAGLNRDYATHFFEKTAIAQRLKRRQAEQRKDVQCQLEKIIQRLSLDVGQILSEGEEQDFQSKE